MMNKEFKKHLLIYNIIIGLYVGFLFFWKKNNEVV